MALPDGCVDLVFRARIRADGRLDDPMLLVAGPAETAETFPVPVGEVFVGWRLRPGSDGVGLGIAPRDLRGRLLAADEVSPALGRLVARLAELHTAAAVETAVTSSLEAAWRNVDAEGVGDRARIDTGDARRLPYPGASFDVVLSLLCLHNIEPAADRVAACGEIARVLRPSGTALVADDVGAKGYLTALRAHGLDAALTRSWLHVALGPMRVVTARKPG